MKGAIPFQTSAIRRPAGAAPLTTNRAKPNGGVRKELCRRSTWSTRPATCRLGLPQAERPRARDDPLQGPVPEPRRAGRAPHPLVLSREGEHANSDRSGASNRGRGSARGGAARARRPRVHRASRTGICAGASRPSTGQRTAISSAADVGALSTACQGPHRERTSREPRRRYGEPVSVTRDGPTRRGGRRLGGCRRGYRRPPLILETGGRVPGMRRPRRVSARNRPRARAGAGNWRAAEHS